MKAESPHILLSYLTWLNPAYIVFHWLFEKDLMDPGEVGIPLRRRAVFPAGVALQLAVPPFLDVEGRVRHHEVGAEVRVLVAGEGVRRFLAEVEVDAADGHVHRRQPPGGRIAFLTEDHDVADGAAVLLDEALGLDKEDAGAHRRIIDAALIGLDHFHDEADDGLGREILIGAPAPTLRASLR